MDRIGVRELRQHASRYLARVRAGETIEVTDRGTPVARMVPVSGTSWDDLVASGQLVPPVMPASKLVGLEPLDLGFCASDELERLRADER